MDHIPKKAGNKEGEQYPEYDGNAVYETEQPVSDVPIAEENPNQGFIPPSAIGELQSSTNKTDIKQLPKSVLVKPATNTGSTSTNTQSGDKKSIYRPLSK